MDPRNLAASPYAPPMGPPQYQQLLGALHQMQSAPTVPAAPSAPPADSLTLSQGAAPVPAANPALTPYLQNGTFSRLTEMLHQLMTGQAPVQQQPAPSAEPWNNPNYPQPAAPPAPPAPPAQEQPKAPTVPPAPPAPPASSKPDTRSYTVQKGDSLSKIAKRELGSANRWREIFELNKDAIQDPNRIFPGQVLKLPKEEAQAPKPDKPEPKPKPEGSGPVLKLGARGGPVRKLQERLKDLGLDPGSVDGIMGPKTVAAVKRFQDRKGIKADGVVGPRTWDELGIKVEGKVQYPPSGNSDKRVDIGGPQPAVRRQGHYIGVRVADKFDAMLAAAARDGIHLQISSGYRSRAEQEKLWRANPNPRYVAPPGTSNHEQGDAIDFRNTPGAYAWLKRNASRFGLHNYPPEPWHYSLNGR